MKKFVASILALVMIFSFTACGEETTQNANDVTVTSQEEKADDKQEEKKDEIIFNEIVAVENDECVVKITGIDEKNIWGYTLKAFLENKSMEKTYMFSVESAAINGVQCDVFFASEVAPGKKANEDISFMDASIDKSVIGEYTDIELTFRIYDSNDWTADAVAVETIRIYPFGEDKAIEFVRENQPNDNIIVNNDYATVIVTGYENDEIWGYTVKLFLINKTDKNIMFSVDDASINGFMIDPFYAKSVIAGKCVFSSMSWYDTMLDENGITDIEEIEFNLRAHDENNWMSDDLVNENIILNP